MSEEHSGAYTRIWLHLVKEGGWHSCREVFGAVLVISGNRSKLLEQMAKAGYLVKKQGGEGKNLYGVTSACRVPRFVSVGEVAQAVGG